MSHIVIVGATASGKSSLSVDIAHELGSEIISLDSMQIYTGMEVGTGVIPVNDRRGIVHHMLTFSDPRTNYSVSQFKNDVYSLVDSAPEKRYVFVGGTGLYTHAIVDNFSFAPANSEIRQQVIEEFDLDEHNPNEQKVAQAYLYLNQVDPDSASKIDPLNVRRIIRSLESLELGEKFSSAGTGIQTFADPYLDVIMIGLRYTREILRKRITQRIDEMLRGGWIEEVEQLAPIFLEMTMPAQNAIGYTPLYEWIMEGKRESTFSDVREHIINKTSQFSRRQRKWFERDPRIEWIDCDELDSEAIFERAYAHIPNRTP